MDLETFSQTVQARAQEWRLSHELIANKPLPETTQPVSGFYTEWWAGSSGDPQSGEAEADMHLLNWMLTQTAPTISPEQRQGLSALAEVGSFHWGLDADNAQHIYNYKFLSLEKVHEFLVENELIHNPAEMGLK